MTSNSSYSPALVVASVVIIVVFMLAAATAIYIARPDQAGVIIPVLIAFVAPTVVGLMALARSDRSVDIAHQAKDQAIQTGLKTAEVAEKVDGRMSEILRLLQTTAQTQVGKDDLAALVREAALAGMSVPERRATEDTAVVHAAEDLAAARIREDEPPVVMPPEDG